MNYFINCITLDDAKNLFRTLCKKLHPDTSGYGSQTDFIAMFKEFKQFKPSQETKTDANFNADKFYNLVQNFQHLKDIKISFVGSFIWVEDIKKGATYLQKESIKNINLEGMNSPRFARKKIAWYFSPSDYKQKFGGRKTLSQIKNTYGCNSFSMKGAKQIA